MQSSSSAPSHSLRASNHHGSLASVRGVVLSLAVVLFGVITLAARPAEAQAERVPFLSDKLRDPDFRVRTNAALALGATDAETAVDPLCGALGDSTDVVRQASAAALQRLNKKKALGCLGERAKVETNETVRSQIAKALAAIGATGQGDGGGGSPSATPRENADAKYYVQIAQIVNRTDRPTNEVEPLVRAAVMQKLDSLGVFQVAPAQETIPAAKTAMAKRKLKTGFYLNVSIAPISYAGGVRAQVSVAISSYPGKSLKGELSASSTGGGSKGDTSVENAVIERAAASAIGTFGQNVEQLL